MMEAMASKDLNIEFLVELLKEERGRRQAAENEVKMLRSILEPLQQKELDRIKSEEAIRAYKATPMQVFSNTARRETSTENTSNKTLNSQPVKEGSVEEELATYVRDKFPRRGRIVCDCGECDNHTIHDDEAD